MGLFDDAGIDSSELDTGLKDGEHPAKLVEIVGRHEAKNVGDDGVQRYYSVFTWETPDHDYPVKDFYEVLPEGVSISSLDDTDDGYNIFVNPRTKKEVRQTEKRYFLGKYRNLKNLYLSLGVPEDKVNSVKDDDLLNIEAVITTRKNRQGYANIQSVSVPGSSGASIPTRPTGAAKEKVAAGSNPFAR